MSSVFKLFLICSLILIINNDAYAQNKKLSVDDQLLQDSIYKSNKKKVLNFSMKEFDALFFEYFSRKNNPDTILSKNRVLYLYGSNCYFF